MVRTFVLALLFILSVSSLSAKDNLSSQIATFNETVKNVGTVDYQKNCTTLSSPTTTKTFSYSRPKDKVYSKLNNKTIELSVLTEKEAKEIFDTLKADEDNSFNYPLDGCYARAHMMASKMDDLGIVSGKAFVEGDLFVPTKMGEAEWSYHVASLLMVKIKGKNVPTIFDPAMFDKPVSYEVWKKKLLADKRAKFQSEYFTKRFNYDPDSRYEDMEDYLEDQVEDMKTTTKNYRMQAEMLERMYGDDQ